MKILKYLVIIVGVLTILFFALGVITPSVNYKNEVTVNKSTSEAWAVMADESLMSEWINGYEKTELISGTPYTVGAVSKIYFDNDGEKMEVTETITAIEENKSLAMSYTMDFMNMDYELMMEEKAGVTHITSTSNVSGNGMAAKSIVSLISGPLAEQEQQNLDNLKKVIEANSKHYHNENQADTTTLVN